VRELVNLLERAAILNPRGSLDLEPPRRRTGALAPVVSSPEVAAGWPSLASYERDYITRVLERAGGKVYGPGGAAEILGLKPTTLQSRMLKLGIRRAMHPQRHGEGAPS